MSWESEFDKHFYPYLMKHAKTEDKKNYDKKELNTFLKKILREDYGIDIILAIYFFLDEKVNKFLRSQVKKLINTLNIRSQGIDKVSKGAIKGKLQVKQTIKEFRVKQRKPSYFKCKEINRTYNNLENLLLKYLLNLMEKRYNELPDNLIIKSEDEIEEEYKDANLISKKIHNIHRELRKALNNIKVRSIPIPKKVTLNMIKSAKNNRNPLYKRVYEIYDLYKSLFITDSYDEKFIQELLDFKTIVPVSANKQFEIFVLILILKSFEESETYEFEELRLIISGRDYAAKFKETSGKEVRVYYNTLPEKIKEAADEISEYKKISKIYSINSNIKRPDIIFEIGVDNFEKKCNYLFLEVKNTEKMDYIRDSIYKCFGYLHDFKKLLDNKQKPKIILVIDKLGDKKNLKTKRRDLIILTWTSLLPKTKKGIPEIVEGLKKSEIVP